MIDNGYRTFGANFNSRIKYKKGVKNFWATGFTAFGDQASSQKLNSLIVNVPLSFTIRLNAVNTLTNAISAGFGQCVLLDDNLSWGAQYNGISYDPSLPSNEVSSMQKFSFLDLGYGVNWNYNKQSRTVSDVSGITNTIGFSASHINRPISSFQENSNERLNMKFVLFESATFHLKNSKLSLNPSLLLAMQGGHRKFIVGTMCRYELVQESRITGNIEGAAISAGIFRRTEDAFVFSTLYELANFHFGLSYDINTSSLNQSTGYRGGLEICLKYVMPSRFAAGSW